MKFYSELAKSITPYTAGEQPVDKRYIKLNTNENAYPPSPRVCKLLKEYPYEDLRLYPDPMTLKLKEVLAREKGVNIENIFTGNGSDEVLSMCVAAFFNPSDTVAYADITYSFYEVYAAYYKLNPRIIPLKNYRLIPEDYILGSDVKGILIANPNAPTGVALGKEQIEFIIKNNSDKIVIIDQAYIAFCEENVIPLIKKYDNLVVVETMSKSYSLAGIRCGYAFANENLINAMDRIKNSINSYTVNRLSLDVAACVVSEKKYYDDITKKIVLTRERIRNLLLTMGIEVLPSDANFLFVRLNNTKKIYLSLKEKGILVRYFDKKGVDNFIRLTIGTDEDMDTFIKVLSELLAQNT